MFGDRDNADREFACQSNPRTECVLPPSRPGADVFTNVYVYYHGAGAETRYDGGFRADFLSGPVTSREFKSNITVKKDESTTNQAILSTVTSTPGTYKLTFALTARTGEPARTHPINEEVAVAVR